MTVQLRQPGIFGQLTLGGYTVVILGFKLHPDITQDQCMQVLQSATTKIVEAYPFLGGKIVRYGQSDTTYGSYKVEAYSPEERTLPILTAHDCSQGIRPYDEIVQSNAPFSMLSGEHLSFFGGVGHGHDARGGLPVLAIRANFVTGGLLLTFASMHNVLDMNGQGILIRMFASVCRGEELDETYIRIGNQDADTIVPFLEEGEPLLDHDDLRRPSTLIPNNINGSLPDAPWHYWRFPREKLQKLKALANDGQSRISTNDAVTAFLTQRLAAVRIRGNRLGKDESTTCFRAVNLRKPLKVPIHEAYLGHLVGFARAAWDSSDALVQGSLGDAARTVRESTDLVDDYFVRSLATLIRDTEDKSTIFYGAKARKGKDLIISSWAQLLWLSTCSFGEDLGVCEFVRRPKLGSSPDLAYVLPRTKDGHMDLATGLFPEDIQGLMDDPLWREFSEHIG